MRNNLKKIENSFGVTKRRPLNRDLKTWRRQINAAIKLGKNHGKSVWGNRLSEEEEKEWTW